MLKILWKRGKIAPEEQFLPLSTIFYCLMLDFYVKTGIRFSLRDKRLFEITRVDCIFKANCIISYPEETEQDMQQRIKKIENKLYISENHIFPLYEYQEASHL